MPMLECKERRHSPTLRAPALQQVQPGLTAFAGNGAALTRAVTISPPYSSRDQVSFRVLLIEDNPGDVVITRAALLECGISVELHVARDGVDAIRFLRKTAGFEQAPTPDLIILDWQLPFRGGASVLEEIKNDPSLAQLPVVIYSSSDARPDVRSGYNLGGNCWVTKRENLSAQFSALADIARFWSKVARRPQHPDGVGAFGSIH